MVVQEGLGLWIELRLKRIGAVDTDAGQPSGDRIGVRQRLVRTLQIEPTIAVARIEQDAQRTRDQHLGTGAGRDDLATHHGHSGLRVEHVDPGTAHHLGDAAPCGHADLAPRAPVDGDRLGRWVGGPHGRGHLAHQVVRRAIVSLPGVAKAPGDRGKDHAGAQRAVEGAGGLEQIKEAIGLDVKDQVELARLLIGQKVAAL